jgi:hypothetical protein
MQTNIHPFVHTSLSSSQNEKCFGQSCRENQKTDFMFDNFFSKDLAVCETMCKNIV